MPISLVVWSSLNYFPAHHPLATNSMHLQPTYNMHLQHLFNQSTFRIQSNIWWSFFAEIVNIFRLLVIFAEELHRGCMKGFLMHCGWQNACLMLWDFIQINKHNVQLQSMLNKTFCHTPPPCNHQQLKHPHKTKINRIMLSASPTSFFYTKLTISELKCK